MRTFSRNEISAHALWSVCLLLHCERAHTGITFFYSLNGWLHSHEMCANENDYYYYYRALASGLLNQLKKLTYFSGVVAFSGLFHVLSTLLHVAGNFNSNSRSNSACTHIGS